MKQRVEEMEAEAKKLRELQAAAEKSAETGASSANGEAMETEDDRQAADERSVYVGNVSTTSSDKRVCEYANVWDCVPPVWLVLVSRLTTTPRLRTSKRISKHVGQSTESPFCVTSSLVIRKGTSSVYFSCCPSTLFRAVVHTRAFISPLHPSYVRNRRAHPTHHLAATPTSSLRIRRLLKLPCH
jgi:hypothetical protein